ncbi:MAG: prenyltransferase/squalene oxidase repeat-containing protein [Bacillota bacterium]
MGEHLNPDTIIEKIRTLTDLFVNAQHQDGAWYYCFEASTITDAYAIILMLTLNINESAFIHERVDRILASQEPSGVWKLFHDEPEGNLSLTTDNYFALLASGYVKKDSPEMLRAKEFILCKGGPRKAGAFTKLMLTLTGKLPWSDQPNIPVEIILLPTWFPVNFFDLVGYNRVHTAPILVCADRKFVSRVPGDPDISDLFPPSQKQEPVPEIPRFLHNYITNKIGKIPLSRNAIHDLSLKKLEEFILDRIEENGTLYSYFTTTALMIFALRALGYDKYHPVIVKGVEAVKNMVCRINSVYHQLETTSTVWDTALITYVLQEAGLPYSDRTILNAASFLLSKQQTKYADWSVHNTKGKPGGWGFSYCNTINPDVDDTSYSLRALHGLAANNGEPYNTSWDRGLQWLLSMQNNDGGWPAFEKNTYKKWPDLLPIPGAKSVWTDPSAADLTGRTIEFLCNHAGISADDDPVKRGVKWLLKNQEDNGSFFGRWGVSYIYGTWAAVTGLMAAKTGVSPAVEKAVDWLLSIQNRDGGWGESCLSDHAKRYVPLDFSTPSQTAWAVDALVSAGLWDHPAVKRGVKSLLAPVEDQPVASSYPTGSGLPGGFYINYNSYRYTWPLLALSHYLKKIR